MPKPKGGRGHAAPYDTKLMRVPVPLADQVQQLVERYQDFIAAGGEAYAPPPLLDAIAADNPVNNFDELNQQFNELNLEWVNLKNDFWLEKKSNEALRREIKKIQSKHDNQEIEINELHQKNGDLNLQVEILNTQLKDASNPVNKFELKEDIATAEYWEATALDIEKQATKVVNNLYEIEDKAVNSLQPLSQRQLGKRLGISHQAISRYKLLTSLGDWTRQRDPEGIAWEYDEQSKLFQPLKLQ